LCRSSPLSVNKSRN